MYSLVQGWAKVLAVDGTTEDGHLPLSFGMLTIASMQNAISFQ
jgi:hypothetical protein